MLTIHECLGVCSILVGAASSKASFARGSLATDETQPMDIMEAPTPPSSVSGSVGPRRPSQDLRAQYQGKVTEVAKDAAIDSVPHENEGSHEGDGAITPGDKAPKLKLQLPMQNTCV